MGDVGGRQEEAGREGQEDVGEAGRGKHLFMAANP